MWDLGDEDKEPARKRNILALSVSLQYLAGWVQFNAGAKKTPKPKKQQTNKQKPIKKTTPKSPPSFKRV